MFFWPARSHPSEGTLLVSQAHVSILMRVGDDFGSSAVGMKGTLRVSFP